MSNKLALVFVLLALVATLVGPQRALACRVGSDKLKVYAQKSIARLLAGSGLKSIYWAEEPLNPVFSLADKPPAAGQTNATEAKLLHDIIVTCSSDKNRLYTLTINLEINNPFKVVELEYLPAELGADGRKNEVSSGPQQRLPQLGKIQVNLPQSALLVQLDQRISYDGCLEVSYVQLAPNVVYDIKCLTCDSAQQRHLDNIFNKKLSQLDSELDTLLSEKVALSLRDLFSQHRLDLDLFMS